MTVIFMDFPQSLGDHVPEKSDPIAHNGKQNVLVYRIWQNLLKFLQGVQAHRVSQKVHPIIGDKILTTTH